MYNNEARIIKNELIISFCAQFDTNATANWIGEDKHSNVI